MKWLWRILGGTVVVVVVCIAGLWLAGMRSGHGHNAGSVVINRPAAQVWRYLSDDELTKKWLPSLSEIRHLTPGVTGAGEKLLLKESYKGQVVEMMMTMTRVEPPRRMEFTLEGLGDPSNGFMEKAQYVLEEKDGKTQVTLSGDTEYYGRFVRLMEPLITPAADKKLGEDLLRLKSIVEAEPPAEAAH
ncbi:MAG TPA: SRPBCC family protein [Candidatus Binatia bacterium]|nr:SRPBCC family protein [Candidatus Binatia bacterium]